MNNFREIRRDAHSLELVLSRQPEVGGAAYDPTFKAPPALYANCATNDYTGPKKEPPTRGRAPFAKFIR